MKKTLASILAAAILAGPLHGAAPAFAQAVGEAGVAGEAFHAPSGVAGAAGLSPLLSPGSFGPSVASIGAPSLSAAVAPTIRAGVGLPAPVVAAASAARASSAALPIPASLGEGRGEGPFVVASRADASRPLKQALSTVQGEGSNSSSLASVRQFAATADPKAFAIDGRSRLTALFDAARRVPAAAADPVPAGPQGSGGVARALRSLGRNIASSAVGRLMPASLVSRLATAPDTPPAPAKPSKTDEWGGPKSEPRSLARQSLYGLGKALSMAGIASILTLTLTPLISMVPWPLIIPHSWLGATGRVELLTAFGPQEIAEHLVTNPLSFLFVQVPMAIFHEEIGFRLLKFGLWFIGLAGLKPLAAHAARFLDEVPDLFRLRAMMQWGARQLGKVSRFAFPIAAVVSSVSFAMAHIPAWGLEPVTLATQAILGLVLVRAAYVTRGLAAPLVAHLAFTFLTLAPAALALAFGLPAAAATAQILIGVFGLAALWHQFRLHRKLSKAPTALMALVLAATAIFSGMNAPSGTSQAARFSSTPAAVSQAAARLTQAPALAAPDTIPPEILQQLQKAFAEPAAPAGSEVPLPELVSQVKPSVVMVRLPDGSGSGFIVSKDGLLVTNAHVAVGQGVGGRVMIMFPNGQIVPAKVVAINTDRDLSLVQLPPNPKGWPALELGDNDALAEGQDVVAMGYPMGLPFSVSKGIVSGLGFRGNGYVHHIQHDAAVNPGNSGGPLFDRRGRVVGVNTAIISHSGGFDGISLSIPVTEVKRAIEQYRATGVLSSSYLGIIVAPANELAADARGVKIEYVRPGSAAAKAGIQDGDIIAGTGARAFPPGPQAALSALIQTLAAKNPGETITLVVMRPTPSGMLMPLPVQITLDAKIANEKQVE